MANEFTRRGPPAARVWERLWRSKRSVRRCLPGRWKTAISVCFSLCTSSWPPHGPRTPPAPRGGAPSPSAGRTEAPRATGANRPLAKEASRSRSRHASAATAAASLPARRGGPLYAVGPAPVFLPCACQNFPVRCANFFRRAPSVNKGKDGFSGASKRPTVFSSSAGARPAASSARFAPVFLPKNSMAPAAEGKRLGQGRSRTPG